MAFVGRDTFAAVAARSMSTMDHRYHDHHHHRHHHHPTRMLPTPPNSISPSLPPQRFLTQLHESGVVHPPTPQALDSDLDLQEADHHLKELGRDQDHGSEPATGQKGKQQKVGATRGDGDDDDDDDNALREFDPTGAITPALLAKHHLPKILLDHGPLAIRHVMSYLTISVPGFSGISAAKARRLVVGALEGKMMDGDGESQGVITLSQDVMFEKVGWGRWDARIRGQAPRNRRRHARTHHTSPPSPSHRFSVSHDSSHTINTTHTTSTTTTTTRPIRVRKGPDGDTPLKTKRHRSDDTSYTEESVVFSHDDDEDDKMVVTDFGSHDDATMLDDEADKMSLDVLHRDDPDNDHHRDEVGSVFSSSAAAGCPADNRTLDVGHANINHSDNHSDNDDDDDHDDDVTDDEDWEKIGAVALRQACSLPIRRHHRRHHHQQAVVMASRRGGVDGCTTEISRGNRYGQPLQPSSLLSLPLHTDAITNMTTTAPAMVCLNTSATASESNPQEREAIEALVRLSSV